MKKRTFRMVSVTLLLLVLLCLTACSVPADKPIDIPPSDSTPTPVEDTYTAEGYYPLRMMDNSVIVYDGEGKPTVVEGGYLTPEEIEKKDPVTSTAKYMRIQPNTKVEYNSQGLFMNILFEIPAGSGNYQEEPDIPPRKLGECDKPEAVFNGTLKDAESLVKVEVQLGDDYLFTVEDPEKIVPLGEMFANATLIPYTPKTYNFTATIHFIYEDGTITSVPSDLGAYLCYMDDNYYNFAFRANGETLTALTEETVPGLLEMENWDESVGWHWKYRNFIAGL